MPTNEELKEMQRRQWSANAVTWDKQHDRLERDTALVSQWLCREAHLAPGMRVLDLASGSGHPALIEATLVLPGGSVTASDLAPEMVEALRRRAAEAGLDNLQVRVLDAEDIDFPDDSFDAVTMRFGLMFCPQPERAVAEIRRVLRPGGRFALAVWDEVSKSPAMSVINDALARIGRPAPPDSQNRTPFSLSAPGALEAALRGGGFAEFATESLPLLWEYESFAQFWEERALRSPSVRTLMSNGNAEDVERLRLAVMEGVRPYTSAGRISLTATALCASGNSQ